MSINNICSKEIEKGAVRHQLETSEKHLVQVLFYSAKPDSVDSRFFYRICFTVHLVKADFYFSIITCSLTGSTFRLPLQFG